MWSGPEHSSLNAGVKSSRQALGCMAEQFQSPPVDCRQEPLVKRATPVKGALLRYCTEITR